MTTTKTWLQEWQPYLDKAVKMLDRPLWKDKPYSNCVHVVAELIRENEKLKAEVERLKDADVTAGVIRMENKKIGGTLSAICKLLKEDGSEKRYHDQADIDSLLGDKQP